MGGEVTTKLLVLMAGLIALGACVSPLLFDPAVREAEEENLLEPPGRDPLLVDRDADGVINAPDVVETEDPLVTDPLVVAPLAADPEPTVVPFFVTIAVLVVALIFTAWALVKPAATLGRPALIAGIVVLVGTLLAWGLHAAGLSEFAMTGAALAAWISVGLTLLAAWLVADVLSTPAEDSAVAG